MRFPSVVVAALLLTALAASLATAPAGAGPMNHGGAPGTTAWTQFQGGVSLSGVASSNSPGGSLLYRENLSHSLGASLGNPLANDFPYQASPVTDGGTVVVALGNDLLATWASNGSLRWVSTLPGGSGGGPVVGTPVLYGGTVFVDQDGGPNTLDAYALSNGSLLYSLRTPGGSPAASSLVIAGGWLGVADTAGGFFWHAPSPSGAWYAAATPGGAAYFATPSVTDGGGPGALWVLPDQGNRSLDVFTPPPSSAPWPGFPEGVGGGSDRLYSSAAVAPLTEGNGTSVEWALFGGDGGSGAPSHLYAASLAQAGVIVPLTVPSLGTADVGIRSSPAVLASGSSAAVVFGNRMGVVSRADLQLGPGGSAAWHWVWNFSTGGPVESSPVIAGDSVLVGSEDGSLYALDLATGALQWSLATQGPLYASLAVENGTAFAVDSQGNLWAVAGTSPAGVPPGPTSGSNPLLGFLVVLGVVIAAVVIGVVLLLRRRDPRRPPNVSPWTTAPAGPPSPPSGSAPPPPPWQE